jgi:ABC-2 type transport system ATP-binding protein
VSDPSVRVQGLTRRFGDFVAVRDVSFEVERGEIFGYLGANGAGKTTTIRILCGLLAPSAGEVSVSDVDVVRRPEAVRRAIGYMSQRFSLYLDLTVDENLAFFGGAYDLFGRAFRARRDAVLRELDLEEQRDRITASLPGGIRQRLALACAILHEPPVVFLDEPTAGVDPDARRMFWRLIRRLADRGTTLFVTTHYMDEAEYCDRVGFMVDGRLAALDTPARLERSLVPGRMLEVHGASAREVEEAVSGVALLGVEPWGAALRVRVAEDGPGAAELRGALERRGLAGATVSDAEVTLEDVFLRVVRGGPVGGGSAPEGGGAP